jgi:type IX secretion system PorP/SprF family membrane protein
MGAIAGFNQFSIKQDELNWGDDVYDPAVIGQSKTNFDLGVGFWFYTSKFFAGLSSTQIGQSKVDFSNSVAGSGVLSRHYYFTTGYKVKFNKDLMLIPSVLVKGTPTAMQVDLNSKVRYKDRYWAGGSYRYQDAIVVLGGVSFPLTDRRHNQRHGNNVMLDIGYAYDLTTSRIGKYSGGSHEIMLGLRIPTFGRIINPQDYW